MPHGLPHRLLCRSGALHLFTCVVSASKSGKVSPRRSATGVEEEAAIFEPEKFAECLCVALVCRARMDGDLASLCEARHTRDNIGSSS